MGDQPGNQQIAFQFGPEPGVDADQDAGKADEFDEIVETQPAVLTVSELNRKVRGLLEGEFPDIWVRGEISNFKPHSSGHFYFSLKDDGCQINAVMFRGFNQKLKFRPENGMEVIVGGKITVYEPRGTYQVFCETMEPVGAGALQQAFEQLKAKLQAEGLFDSERKRALPAFPKTIGIVTSPTGAAIKDILNVLSRRYRTAHIIVVPVLVQGDGAAQSIVAGIEQINKVKGVDVLIVGRGGGSMEDLWAFNEEPVARAIAASKIPVISAVGHEVDFTIADFVADLRAPTPSAAAELVAKNAADILERIQSLKARLWQCYKHHMKTYADRVNFLAKRLVHPERRLQDLSLRCDELSLRLDAAMKRYLEAQRKHLALVRQRLGTPYELLARLEKKLHLAELRLQSTMSKIMDAAKGRMTNLIAHLDAMSPLRVAERGYSIVSRQGHIVRDADALKTGDEIDVRFAKGTVKATVNRIEK